MKKNILVCVAHRDDETIGCGATFYKKNYETTVSEYLKTKFINKVFVFKKDSCLITLTK